MKLKTAAISIVVSAALVAGAGYGAYYAMQGKKQPVEVVPVSNVNMGYWNDSAQSIYGTVTSQMAQVVTLDEEHEIAEIYVSAGDQVKEGTPLFSYDMTLEELELEMEELDLQTQELTKMKLEKDLNKLKGVGPNASMEELDSILTSSGEEVIVEGGQDVPAGETAPQTDTGTGGGENSQPSSSASSSPSPLIEGIETGDVIDETQGETASSQTEIQTEKQQESSAEAQDETPGEGEILIEGIQELGAGETEPESDSESELTGETEDSEQGLFDLIITRYKVLVDAISLLFEEDLDSFSAQELQKIGEAIEQAVNYYRSHLADEIVTQEQDENGETVTVRSYAVKEDVKEELGEEELKELEQYSKTLDGYHVKYVELLIDEILELREAEAEEEAKQIADQIRAQYEKLATAHQKEVREYFQSATADPGSYTVTVRCLDENGNLVTELPYDYIEPQQPGELVTVTAPQDSSLLAEFKGWEISSPEALKNQLAGASLTNPVLEFTMPEGHVVLTARYHSLEEKIASYIGSFLEMSQEVLADGAAENENYLIRMANTIVFYQMWLAEIPDAAGSGTSSDVPSGDAFTDMDAVIDELTGTIMEHYQLKKHISAYLEQNAGNGIPDAAGMEEIYKNLCQLLVKTLYQNLDSAQLEKESLDQVFRMYDALGGSWQEELEQAWQNEQAVPGGAAAPSIWDGLNAYEVLLMFQDYQKLDPNTPEEERALALGQVMQAFAGLTDTQKAILLANPAFAEAKAKYDAENDQPQTESETESESESEWWPGGGDDFWGGDDDSGYTAEEIKQMIEDKEREIKNCELDIREIELSVNQRRREVDGKTVKSTMDGTVISIGELDGSSEDDYFAKVANESGLYAQGAMNELSLEQIKVGDTISGMMTDTGVGFTAVIKEISQYPDASGESMSFGYGTENTNSSYYPFYALLDSTEDIEEGQAEIQLTAQMSAGGDGIYLESYFVRDENDGRSYVWKQGEDGTLTKQYIKKGQLIYSGMGTEITEGLTEEDKIAFPYGKDVAEGAPTKDVDSLSLY